MPCRVLILVLCHVLTPCRVSLLHSMSCLDYENLNCQVELFLVSMYKKNPNILYRKRICSAKFNNLFFRDSLVPVRNTDTVLLCDLLC